MTKQEIHNSLKLLKSKRKEILELKEEIAEVATHISGSSWSSPKVTGGTFTTPQERYLERSERLYKQLDDAFDEYGDLCCKLLDLMEKLSPTEYEVILNRFFREMSMKRTAELMGLSVDWVKDIQAEAIKLMSEFSGTASKIETR